MTVILNSALSVVLEEIDSCYLECDGLTRVISSLLTTSGITHKVYIGKVLYSKGRPVQPHLWVELQDGTFIDYRLRLWLGQNTDIPHGVFHPSNFQNIEYTGDIRENFGERDAIAMILCMTANLDFEKTLEKLEAASLN